MSEKTLFIEEGFQPIIGKDPRVLILGTMPSVQSLKSQEYYGHPRNAFWWIMSELCGFDFSLPYLERVQAILKNKIAVWDVVASCYRPGSLDSKIDQSTITPNALPDLIEHNSSLRVIAFNGQAAEKLFHKYIQLNAWYGDKIVLPSTSPANAVLKKEQKLSRWAQLNKYLAS